MSQLRTLNVGGVPEHFNLPWHLALEEAPLPNGASTSAGRTTPAAPGP
jgi:hypothetical protein